VSLTIKSGITAGYQQCYLKNGCVYKSKKMDKPLQLNSVKKDRSGRNSLVLILVVALLVSQWGKGVYSQRMKSSCFDEPLHIQLGLNYWKKQDHGFGFTNPTLPQRIIALPQVLLASDETDPQLWLGRIPVFVTMLMLGVILFVWVRTRVGSSGALISLILYVFCPNILAHGSIAGTDLMAAAAFFISLICYIALIRKVTLIRLIASGSTLGVLFTTKLVAFFILPTLLALGIARSIDPWSLHLFGRSVTRRWQKSLAFIAILLILGGCVVSAIWGIYGLQFRDSWGDEILSSHKREIYTIRTPVLHWAATHRVLPEAYLLAINMMLTVKNTGYLRGENSYQGWWWYFPYALFVKTPIPTLLFFLFGFGAAVKLSRHSDKPSADVPPNVLEWMGLILSVIFYTGISMTSSYNVGIRLILPIYPCLFSLVGLSISHFEKIKILRYTLCVLIVWLGFTFVYQNRDPIAYFNEFAGGSKNGYKHLLDSNLDWGQDLPLLAQYLEEQEDQEVWLQYFGSVSPSLYDIDARPIIEPYSQPESTGVLLDPLSDGLYVVSLTNLFGEYILDTPVDHERWITLHRKVSLYNKGLLERESHNLYETTYRAPPTMKERIALRSIQGIILINQLKQREPDDRIGYTMFVYQLTDEEIAELISPPGTTLLYNKVEKREEL